MINFSIKQANKDSWTNNLSLTTGKIQFKGMDTDLIDKIIAIAYYPQKLTVWEKTPDGKKYNNFTSESEKYFTMNSPRQFRLSLNDYGKYLMIESERLIKDGDTYELSNRPGWIEDLKKPSSTIKWKNKQGEYLDGSNNILPSHLDGTSILFDYIDDKPLAQFTEKGQVEILFTQEGDEIVTTIKKTNITPYRYTQTYPKYPTYNDPEDSNKYSVVYAKSLLEDNLRLLNNVIGRAEPDSKAYIIASGIKEIIEKITDIPEDDAKEYVQQYGFEHSWIYLRSTDDLIRYFEDKLYMIYH